MLVFKMLHMNLLNIVILLTLKVVLGDHPIRLEIFRLSSNQSLQIQPKKKQEYCVPNSLWTIKT